MKKKRFTEEQIIAALKEHEAGAKVADVCRRLGVAEGTLYRWKSIYGGMEVSEANLERSLWLIPNRQVESIAHNDRLDTSSLSLILSYICAIKVACFIV
jgi:putative transposase